MPLYSSYQTLRSDLLSGQTSCTQLVAHYLNQANKTVDYNIYVETFDEEAKATAIQLDKKLKDSPKEIGSLFGMVISIKDVICYKDHKVSAASKMLEEFTSLYTATALQRLLDEDVIVIGRTNCDQFAMGSSNENSYYGPTRNFANINKVPGGSSGGAAVSVQADTCFAALGSDTGGSVRQPAAFCGLVGMKPSYGRISRHGLIAYGSSFDQIGTITHNVEDAAQLVELMSGPDEYDSTTISNTLKSFKDTTQEPQKLKIGYFQNAVNHPKLDPEIKLETKKYLKGLESKGFDVTPIDFYLLEYLVPTYYVLTTAEASSNLSRFDGVRYGFRDSSATSLDDLYNKSRTNGFSYEVKKRIILGTFVLSADFYDAYYTKAQKVRKKIKTQIEELFEEFDVLIMPTTSTIAWDLGAQEKDPIEMYLSDIFTILPNLSGIPAINLPLGQSTEDNMPFGIQFFAKTGNEDTLFSLINYVT